MYIPSNKELTEKQSPRTAKISGILGLVGSISVLFLSIFSGDQTAIWFSAIFCTLLFLISLSLLFGKGSLGAGILPPNALIVFGILAIVVDLTVSYITSSIPLAGILFGFGCFALAKKRRRSKESKI